MRDRKLRGHLLRLLEKHPRLRRKQRILCEAIFLANLSDDEMPTC